VAAKGEIANAFGIVVLVAWLLLVLALYTYRADTEILWSRSTFIFGSVEAIAFAAAGYFFGREVNRERAEKSEDKARIAQGDLIIAQRDLIIAKQNGQNLRRDLTILTRRGAAPNLLQGLTDITGKAQQDFPEHAAANP